MRRYEVESENKVEVIRSVATAAVGSRTLTKQVLHVTQSKELLGSLQFLTLIGLAELAYLIYSPTDQNYLRYNQPQRQLESSE